MSNTFGQLFRWTTFGESHGEAMGVVIDGCPAGVPFDVEELQARLDRRRPGQKNASGQVVVTDRDEKDRVKILSGIFEGKTLGTPISCVVENQDVRSKDYENIKKSARRGHADDVWKLKYGHSDHRGGGRSSGRETLSRVIAGSVAEMFLRTLYPDLKVISYASQIGEHQLKPDELSVVDGYLLQAKENGESYGGTVETWVTGVPPSLGEPIFNKLKSQLASAMMGIGATCGFELGGGFNLCDQPGTRVHKKGDSEVYGGIRGGISTGEKIIFRVGFKPTSSITDVAKKGRHDPCIVPRAIPVVTAMTWAVLADQELLRRSNKI